jgi:O-antigen/teichoic acid export membrane protein
MNRAVRNGFWGGFSYLTAAITGVICSILIVRSLTPQGYGEFSYYLWLAGLFAMMGTLSLPVTITKVTSELIGNQLPDEANTLSNWVMLAVFFLNLALTIGLVAIAFTNPYPRRIYLFEIAFIPIANGVAAISRSSWMGREQYKPLSIIGIVATITQLGIVVFAYGNQSRISGYIAASVSVYMVQMVLLLIFSIKQKTLVFNSYLDRRPNKNALKVFAGFAYPAAIFTILEAIVWQRSEIFFLERMSSIEQVGFYNLAYTVFATLMLLGWALVNGFLPAISRDYGARAWEKIHKKIAQGAMIAVIYAIPLWLGGLVTLPQLIPLIFSHKMDASISVVQILFFGMLPGVLSGMLNLTLSAIGGIWAVVKIGIVVSIINILLAIFLIPHYGANGAAIANTSALLTYTLLLITVLAFQYRIYLPWGPMMGICLIGILTTFLLPVFIQTIISGYAGLLIAIGIASSSYIALIWRFDYLKRISISAPSI